jgi:two-component system cell cycle response regulator
MPVKILSVDDSKTIRLIINRAFKSYDCQVFEAANGLEGMATASREKPDVIILDVTMPIMDGMEMLGMLKANHELRSIPVVMLTAEAGRDTVLRIAKMGVRDYLIKPFKEDQIVERVSRIVSLEAISSFGKPKKRFDDPINILLVDDKVAIWDQLRQGLADTSWQIEGVADANEALKKLETSLPDVILISTSLPESSGFSLLQKLRAGVKSQRVPVFALMVKTALMDQARAQTLGFTGIITKPIDYGDLKSKVARNLNLDSSYRYFAQRDNMLWLTVPETICTYDSNEISNNLGKKTSEAVDSGLDKVVMDLRQLKKADIAIIELSMTVVKTAQDLSMRVAFLVSPSLHESLSNFQETKGWLFVTAVEDLEQAFTTGTAPVAPDPVVG